jgi:putative FmdB family regulatory protein
MPLYEYHCEGCGRDFEEQQSLNFDPAETDCPYCNQKKAVRKISAVSMSIKGPTRKPRTSDIKAEQGMKKAQEVLSKLPPGWGKRGDTTPNVD